MLSIIIPVYNEENAIGGLVAYLLQNAREHPVQIVVVDGGSTDETVARAEQAGAQVLKSPTGRAAQMNFGVAQAIYPVLYFVHADSRPPARYATDIQLAVSNGYLLGRYQTKFDSNNFLLKINAFFTRFDWPVCYGGDQSLFITKELFATLGGFNTNMLIMEEYDLVERARPYGRYKVFNNTCLVSARKYDTNSWLTVQLANRKIMQMWRKGAMQQEMVDQYKRMLVYR